MVKFHDTIQKVPMPTANKYKRLSEISNETNVFIPRQSVVILLFGVLIVDVSEVKLEAKQNNLPPEY
jgi:hypothetical protein